MISRGTSPCQGLRIMVSSEPRSLMRIKRSVFTAAHPGSAEHTPQGSTTAGRASRAPYVELAASSALLSRASSARRA